MVNEVSGDVVFLVAARACLYVSDRQRDGFDWIIFWVETQKIQGLGLIDNVRLEKWSVDLCTV